MMMFGAGLAGCGEDSAGPPQVDPSAPFRITLHGGDHPTVSGDGQWIAFELPTPHHLLLARIRADGTGEETLTSFCSLQPNWSRTSSLIVFRCAGVLYTVDAFSKLTQDLTLSGVRGAPAWSPTGHRLVSKVAEGLAVFDYPGGQRTDLACSDPDLGPCTGDDPEWSPDGQWIAFDDGARILRLPAVGGAAQTVVDGLGDVGEPAWSRDGRYVAFSRMVAAGPPVQSDVWVVDLDDPARVPHQLTFGPGDSSPAFAPGGAVLYFASTRSGRPEIWRIAFTPPTISRARAGSAPAPRAGSRRGGAARRCGTACAGTGGRQRRMPQRPRPRRRR